MIFNIVAIVLSAVALATSTFTALQHQALQRAANFIPAYMHQLERYQTMEFHDRYFYVTTQLKAEHDPKVGISGLPDDARRAVYEVAYFFHGYGTLRLVRVLDDQVLSVMRPRIVSVWEAIEPFVERERELRGFGGLYFLRVLEELAKEAKTLPPESLNLMLARRRFVKIRLGFRRSGRRPIRKRPTAPACKAAMRP